MIAGMTYYQICWYFLIYSFLGWCLEVAYHGVTLGKVVNRGFLNGPVCPVYGFGMLAVLAIGNSTETFLSSSGHSVMTGSDTYGTLLLFAGGVVLATAVELVAGWLLDVLFHTRWWDYSDKPLNFHGYICLEFSLLWGLGVVLVVRIVQPMLEQKSAPAMIPETYGWPILLALYALLLADFIVTVANIVGLNKKIAKLDEARSSMRKVSDGLSEIIGTTATVTAQHVQEGQVQAALAKAELKDAMEEKRVEYEKNLQELRKSRTFRRLTKAFPNLKHRKNSEIFNELKTLLEQR